MAIFLATGDPCAKVEGAQVAVTIPSGKGSVAIALDLHQAMMLATAVRRAASEGMDATRFNPVPACAQIIAFPARRRA